jgi:NAD(P)-dependent dehydrogenase (short-subunit alcohol dehydrogenase family)
MPIHASSQNRVTKTVLITGASSGFGKGAALLFKAKGWNVAASMRSPERAEAWTTPAGLFAPRLDVTDRASMQSAINETVSRFGGIDVLVNNAGFGLLGPLEGASPADIRREVDTNLMGVIEMTQLVLPLMRASGNGVIVNVSSLGGRMTLPLFSTYHATKFAVEGLTETLQYELQGHGIRVKLVEPGGSKTNFDGGSMVRTPHPAYKALSDGFDKTWEKNAAGLPGPEKVVETIYRAATDGTTRLRYPVLTFPFLPIRNLIGARGWNALVKAMARRMGTVATPA